MKKKRALSASRMPDDYNETYWSVDLEEDPETGELVMPLPQAMLAELDWEIGDVLEWKQLPNGDWSLTKKAKTVDSGEESK